MTPLPQEEDDNYDPNVDIDKIIEDKLFDNRYSFQEHMTDEERHQYNFEMRPSLYPDVE
jgi:hypothetical protein